MDYRVKFQIGYRIFKLVKEVVENPEKAENIEEIKKSVEKIKNPKPVEEQKPEPQPEPIDEDKKYLEFAKYLVNSLNELLDKKLTVPDSEQQVASFMRQLPEPRWFVETLQRILRFFGKEK